MYILVTIFHSAVMDIIFTVSERNRLSGLISDIA